MARHDYKHQPKPRWEDGFFIPAAPIPIPKHPDDWDIIDSLQSIRAISRNAVAVTTAVTCNEPYAKTTMFGQTLVVACNPAMIKYIFIEKSENYGLNSIRQAILKPILQNGLITAEGKIWRRARRALSPLFTPRHTKNFAPTMRATAERELPNLFADGKDVDFNQAMLRLAYLVLSDTLFSAEIDSDTEAVLRDVGIFLAALGKPGPLDILGVPKFVPRFGKRAGFKAIGRLRKLVHALSKDRRARVDQGAAVPDDFLTLLLNVQDDDGPLSNLEIEDHIVTFIGAGHETTSRALTWMVYLLSQDKTARAQVEAEADALDMRLPPEAWAAQMPWSMACFNETMRLYPPAPIISRYAVEADQYGDIDIPKNANIMVNLWSLHRHNQLWENPNAFDPARFIGERAKTIDRFQYLPFGMGRRVCIGQRFAMQEAAILIALMFKNYRFDYAGDAAPWPIIRITVQPEHGMPMTAARR